jgi:hypothetical protein
LSSDARNEETLATSSGLHINPSVIVVAFLLAER